MLSRKLNLIIISFSLIFITSCTPTPLRFTYVSNISVTDLGVLPGGRNSTARDINDGGYIVGDSETSNAGDRRAFVIHAQGMQNLGTFPGGSTSRAYGISNNGFIVGSAKTSSGAVHGFVNRYNTMLDLGAYPPEDDIGSYSHAFAVNSTPLIVGKIDLAGVIWDIAGTPNFPPYPPTTIVTNPGPFRPAIAFDINQTGQIAGTLLSESVGFRYTSGSMEKLQALGGADDDAYGINNHGHVVGQALLAPPVRYHAVLWRNPSSVQDIGTLGGDNSSAQDINDSGTVVGYSETAGGETRAFIWRSDLGMRDLGTLGGNNSKAYAINANGIIVGESETASGEVHATRWKVTIISRVFKSKKIRPAKEFEEILRPAQP